MSTGSTPSTAPSPHPRLRLVTCFFYDNARATLLSVLAVTALFGVQILRLNIDNSPEQLLRSDDPELALYAAAREEFGDGMPRDPVRALRQDLAPVEWKRGGAPKTGGRKHGGK